MAKLIRLATCVVLSGYAVLIASSSGGKQIEGALQYPPPSVGEDAQPPSPAGIVPQIVSPRRIELGLSGSSLPSTTYPSRNLLATEPRPSTKAGN
jgi:hypothetical protein